MQSSIGLIGLGAMGTGIAASMSRAGLEFYVHDNDQTKLEEIRKSPLINSPLKKNGHL